MKLLNLIKNIANRDYIVEQGVSGGWTYRKWNSGIAECYGTFNLSSGSFSAYGTLYRSDTSVYFPSGLFTESPIYVNANQKTFSGDGLAFPWRVTPNASVAYITLANSLPTSAGTSTLFIEAKGRWK